MKDLITSRFIVKLLDCEYNVQLDCPSSCFRVENKSQHDCSYLKKLNVGNKVFRVNIFKILIKNTSPKTQKIDDDDFKIIDSNGFLCNNEFVCDDTLIDNKFQAVSVVIPSNSQVRYRIITKEFEDNALLGRIDFRDNEWYSLDVSENQGDILTTVESVILDNIRLNEEVKKLQDANAENRKQQGDDIIKYEIVEDDDYVYLISKEPNHTISFHRQFNTKKFNYNWVDEGEPLISLYIDELSFSYISTQVISPTSGIFEYDKKQFIKTDEVICSIRKYSSEVKKELFFEFEKQTIKDEVFNKERKKRLEREALDELISEGLVFNSYIDKNGNRSKISSDVANAVWNRDGGKCCECGSKEGLEFDHIIPVSKGGATTYHNLQILCKTCNIRKSNKIGLE